MRRGRILAVVLASLAVGADARIITYDGFANLTALAFRGDAAPTTTSDGVVARLTPASDLQFGSLMLRAPVSTAWFRSHFTFRLTGSGGDGVFDCNQSPGGDGFVFVMQRDLDAVGSATASELGYGGIANSVGVEWDTFCNEALADPDSNHVAIDLGGVLDHGIGAPFARSVQPAFDDGSVWHGWVDYDGVTLEVRTRPTGVRPDQPDLAQSLDLGALLGSTTAFVGFTAATGGTWTNHDILFWEYEDDTRRLAGKRLVVKRTKSGLQRLVLVAKDDRVTSDAAVSACRSDGRLIVLPEGASPREFPLAAPSWTPLKAKRPSRGCRFRSKDVVGKVLVKAGKLLKVTAKGEDLGIPLDTDPTPVRVELRHDGIRHCMRFGGDVSFKPGRKLVAKRADDADRCPIVTVTTTTTTTTTLPEGDFFNDCINVQGLCDPREICVSYIPAGIGVCALPCTETTDCPAAIVETAPVQCVTPTDFPTVCMQTCTSSIDCPVGMVCQAGMCYWRVPF